MFHFKKTDHLQRRRTVLRVLVAGLFVVLCFGILGWRLWQLQVVRYEGFAARADRNRIAVVPIAPRRGEITDRNGAVLARNYRDYTLSVVPAQIHGDIEKMLDALGEIVYLSHGDRRRFLQSMHQSGRYS